MKTLRQASAIVRAAAALFAMPFLAGIASGAAASVDAGASFTVTVTSDGTPPLRYQWAKDGTPIAGATLAQFTVASATAKDAGVYTCHVSNSAGAIISERAEITIITKPTAAALVISSQSKPQPVLP